MTPTLNLINDSSCQMNAVHLSANTIKATSAFVERVAAAYPTQQAGHWHPHPAPARLGRRMGTPRALFKPPLAAQHCVRGHCTVNAHALKISYDKTSDSLYIHLADRASVDSDEVKDGVVLDFDANGALVGIDVQHASERADLNNLSLSKLPFGELLAA